MYAIPDVITPLTQIGIQNLSTQAIETICLCMIIYPQFQADSHLHDLIVSYIRFNYSTFTIKIAAIPIILSNCYKQVEADLTDFVLFLDMIEANNYVDPIFEYLVNQKVLRVLTEDMYYDLNNALWRIERYDLVDKLEYEWNAKL